MFPIPIENNRFYILDARMQEKMNADDLWDADADKRRLAISEGLLGVMTIPTNEVVISVRTLAQKPTMLLPDALHIVEASIRIQSSVLQIKTGANNEKVFELPIEKGTYRVRITTQEIIHSKSKDGERINELVHDYQLEMWKSSFAKPTIIKSYKEYLNKQANKLP